MPKYRRVDMIDRCDIDRLKSEGRSQAAIARLLGFNRSTICRELKRIGAYRRSSLWKGIRYYYGAAQDAADDSLVHRQMPRRLRGEVLKYTLAKLDLCWSPEQISRRMKIDLGSTVSHETIYRFIHRNKQEGGNLFLLLRRGKRRRKARFPSLKRIPKRQLLPSIDERPMSAESRLKIGHWERDTLFGQSRKKAILVLVDRKARFIKLAKLDLRTADQTNAATLDLLKGLPAESLTNDRGAEFMKYEEINRIIPTYFCHPYTSQERGTVENQIGLIRQYIPKDFDLDLLTEKDLKDIEEKLNNRPRKTLDWRTPSEVIHSENVALCG